MPLNKYAPQAATHRRTESAILESTKELISQLGISKMSMIEIADTAQVSRATLYNHFRDKDSVLSALCDFEIRGLVALAHSAGSAVAVLEALSIQISTDSALAKLRAVDPIFLTQVLAASNHPLWNQFREALTIIVNSQVLAEVSIGWLFAQVMQPLTSEESRLQAEFLVSRAHL